MMSVAANGCLCLYFLYIGNLIMRDRPGKSGLCTGSEQLLVAILNHPRDLAIAREAHWYRIPAARVEKWLARRWPPQWLAFYQTKVFGSEAFRINYYARVLEVRRAMRVQLFPNEPRGP